MKQRGLPEATAHHAGDPALNPPPEGNQQPSPCLRGSLGTKDCLRGRKPYGIQLWREDKRPCETLSDPPAPSHLS
jgi:hypothetical protein